jgi:TP901 family phage tail tape measure protein
VAERSLRVILKAEVADYKRQMAEAAKATDKIPESAARAETALGRMVQSARYNRESWDAAGRTMLAFGAATIGGLALATKAAVDWESAWAGVLKTVNGTDSELAALEDDLRQMARTLPASHQEIAAVAEAAGQLGVQTPNVAAFTRTMIDLGETTNLSADEAATGLARFANVMGTSQGDFDRLGSTIVGLGNNFAGTEREILDMAQRLSAASRVVGLTEADALGLATAMTSVGIEAEAGGSAVSRVLIKISAAVDKGGDDLAQFAEAAGMSSDAFAQKWRTAPVDALLAVVGGLARMTQTGEGTFGMLEELGFQDIRVTNAMLSLSNATELTSRAVALGNDEWEKNSALLLEAQKRYDTAASRVEVAKNSINDAAITLGQVFLPALADAADGVAGFAQWLADLPPFVQQTAGAIGGLAGGLSLLGGGFLLVFPRIMEAITHFRKLGTTAQATLKGIGQYAALVTAAVAIGKIVDAAQTATVSSEELLNRLVAIESQGAKIDTLFSDIGQGYWDRFANNFLDPSKVDDFRASLEKLDEPSIGFVDWLNDVAGMDGGLRQFGNRLGDVGDEIGSIAQRDLPRAQEMFNRLVEAAGGGDEAVRLLLNRMGGYEDALYSAANAQGLALDETSLLAAATGELDVAGQGAAESMARAAADAEYMAEAQAEATEALSKWREAVATADVAFIDLSSAYQAAIDKSTALAQSTADSTESAEDSWETYYDGVSVSAADYIAQLQAQVDAQTNWETNMTTLAERARTGMSGSMQQAAFDMLNELINLGPEGAAQVALMATMTDEELAQVVTLWGQRGTEAVNEFTAGYEDMVAPEIDVTANLTPAENVTREWMNRGREISVGVRFYQREPGLTPDVIYGGGRAFGGPIPGPFVSPHADNVLIRATPGEYMHQVPAVNYWGRSFMDAVNRMDKAAVASQVQGLAYGGSVGMPVYVGGGGSPVSASAPLVGVMNLNEVTDTRGTSNAVARRLSMLGA